MAEPSEISNMIDTQRFPGSSSFNTKRPTSAEWDQHRRLITDLYIKQNMTQQQVADYMQAKHSFHASEKMFVSRFLKWVANKKMSVKDAQAILNAVARRNDARRKVIKIRLRGREVTEEEARTSLRRRKLNSQSSLPLAHRETTPSSISIVSRDDELFEKITGKDDEHVGGLVADAIMRQRPRSPDLVGDERLEVCFIQKMRDWRQCRDVGAETILGKFSNYSEDLLGVLYLPDPASNRRAQWTLHQLDSVLAQAFAPCDYWLLPHLVSLASQLKGLPPGLEYLVRSIHSKILRAARNAVGDATMHPLLVICSFLYNSKQEQQFSRLLDHCSKFAQTSHEPGSWEYQWVDRARIEYLRCKGRLQEAESLLSGLMEDMNFGPRVENDAVQLYKCELVRVQLLRGKFAQAEEQMCEILEHCREASQQQGVAIVELPRPLADVYLAVLRMMASLSEQELEFTTAEHWAWKTLSYSEQAFGTTHMLTLTAVHHLMRCLEEQAKWAEADALLWEWQDILDPPDLFTGIEQGGSDGDEGEAEDCGDDDQGVRTTLP